MRTRARGFTLVEMMVAVLLASLVMLGLASIFSMALRYHLDAYRKDEAQGGALLGMKTLARDLRMTSYIDTPAPPCPGGDCAGSSAQGADELRGCTNFDSGALMDPAASMRVYRYCVTGGQLVYTWADSAPGATLPCFPAFLPACGVSMAGGSLVLARGVAKDGCPACANYFRRPASFNNVVELHFVVGTASPTVRINAALNAMKTYNSPSP